VSDEDTTTVEEGQEVVDEALEATGHPDVESDDAGSPKQGTEEWWALFGDEADDLREKYADDPAELVKAYRQIKAQTTQQAQELAEFRRYAEEREAYDKSLEEKGSGPEGGPQQGFDYPALIRQAGSLFDGEGEIDVDKLAGLFEIHGAVQNQLIAQAVRDELDRREAKFDEEKVAPWRSQAEEDRRAREVSALEDVYGDRFEAVTAEAHKLKDTYPDMSITALYGMGAAALQTRDANRRRLEAQGYTIGKGGRPTPPKARLSADEAELAAMEAVGKNKSLI